MVKTAKRIGNGNAGPQSSLDNDNFTQAILLYQNILIQGIGLLLAQLLLHHQLTLWFHSFTANPLQPHPEWIVVALHCKEVLPDHNVKMVERYNRYTHKLCPFWAGYTVATQSPFNRWWNTTRKIIVLPDHQYWIRVDGSGRITLRNHCCLRKCEIKTTLILLPSAMLVPIISTSNAPLLHPDPQNLLVMTRAAIEAPKKAHIHQHAFGCWKFLELCPHYKPGLKEQYTPHTTLPTHGWGRCRSHCSNLPNKDNNNNIYQSSTPN